jgi:hypothetical protein
MGFSTVEEEEDSVLEWRKTFSKVRSWEGRLRW